MSIEIKATGGRGSGIDLEGCVVQVDASEAWFHRRVLPLSIEQLRWRPDARHWSIAECLHHLNLTLELYLPKIEDAICRTPDRGTSTGGIRYERAEVEALRRFEPPVIVPVSAPAPTIPGPAVDPVWLVERFHQTRDRYLDAVRRSFGMDLGSCRIIEPIYPVIISLGGTLALIAAHDRRHMWQAERVRQATNFPRAARDRRQPSRGALT